MIFVPDEVRNGIFGKAFLDGHFYFHVPEIIFFEAHPFFAVMLGQIPGPSAICFGGSAGTAEVADKVFPFL